jgi:argininosuccinate lyase
MQRAQPVLFAHYLLSFESMLDRDFQRLEAAFRAADEMPLGSGALAGTPYPIDREQLAAALGFSRVSRNSMDAVSNRDFLCDFLYAVSLLMIHLSRLAADFVLYCSVEFNLIQMGDSVSTGSSLMPQKRNPDAMELVRGKASIAEGRLIGLLGLLRSLPSTYNKDLQEDKISIFATLDDIDLTMKVFRRALRDLKVNESAMREAANDSFLLATDLADYLVQKGVPFRNAHRVIGELVNYALSQGKTLSDLTLEEMRASHESFGPDFVDWLDMRKSLERRNCIGGTSQRQVAAALAQAEHRWQSRRP